MGIPLKAMICLIPVETIILLFYSKSWFDGKYKLMYIIYSILHIRAHIKSDANVQNQQVSCLHPTTRAVLIKHATEQRVRSKTSKYLVSIVQNPT